MATTTNYGWTTPDDTSLVKDGASAIRTLGSSIDTSLNNALGTKKAGLVLLNTTSFSAVASQDITFGSSTYDNYKFIYVASAVVAGDVFIRLGTGGSFNSTSGNYRWNGQYAVYTSASITGLNSGASSTGWLIGNASNYGTIVDVYSPFDTKNSAYTFQSARDDGGYMNGGGTMTVTTSYNQIRFYGPSANISGTVYTYGYNK